MNEFNSKLSVCVHVKRMCVCVILKASVCLRSNVLSAACVSVTPSHMYHTLLLPDLYLGQVEASLCIFQWPFWLVGWNTLAVLGLCFSVPGLWLCLSDPGASACMDLNSPASMTVSLHVEGRFLNHWTTESPFRVIFNLCSL